MQRLPGRCPRAAALLLLAASAAQAEESAVERCRKAANDAERIACLEAALTETETRARADEPASGDAAPVSPPAAAPGADGIGAEQVRGRNRSRDDLESAQGLEVERYTTIPYRRLQVELANGQVWRQIAGDTQRIEVDLRRNRTVDIEESGLGGYKLRLNELGRTIRVERIR